MAVGGETWTHADLIHTKMTVGPGSDELTPSRRQCPESAFLDTIRSLHS